MTDVKNGEQSAHAIYFDTQYAEGKTYYLNIYASIITNCKVDEGAAVYNNGCNLVFKINFLCISDCTTTNTGSILFTYSPQTENDHLLKYISATSCTSSNNAIDFIAGTTGSHAIDFSYCNISSCSTTISSNYPDVLLFKYFTKSLSFCTFHQNTGKCYFLFLEDTEKVNSVNTISFSNFLDNKTPTGLIVAQNYITLNVNFGVIQGNSGYMCDTNYGATINLNDLVYDGQEIKYANDNVYQNNNITVFRFSFSYQFTYYATYNCYAKITYPRMSPTIPPITPEITPYTTPLTTPFTTPLTTPFTTPLTTPFTTPLTTPFTTPIVTPYQTLEQTPCITVGNTLLQTLSQPPSSEETGEPTTSSIEETVEPSTSSIEDDPDPTMSSSENDDPNNADDGKVNGDKDKGLGSTLYIIIGVLAAVLIILAIIAFILIRRKRNAESDGESSAIEFEEEDIILHAKPASEATISLFTTTSVIDDSDPFEHHNFEESFEDVDINFYD